MTVIAHVAGAAGYLYLAPILVVVGAIALQNIRDRRRGDDDEPATAYDEDAATRDDATNRDEGHER